MRPKSDLDSKPDTKSAATDESPEPESDPKPEHAATSDESPEPESDPKPEHTTTSDESPESESDPKPEHTATTDESPEPESDPKPEHTATAVESPESESDPKPERSATTAKWNDDAASFFLPEPSGQGGSNWAADDFLPLEWKDADFYLCRERRSGKKCNCYTNEWSGPCFLPAGWKSEPASLAAGSESDTADAAHEPTNTDAKPSEPSEPTADKQDDAAVSLAPASGVGKDSVRTRGEGWEEVEKVPSSWKKRRRVKKRGGHLRRGKGKKRKSKFYKTDNKLTITLNNCRGWISKKESMEEMLEETKDDIVLLNETLLSKLIVEMYEIQM